MTADDDAPRPDRPPSGAADGPQAMTTARRAVLTVGIMLATGLQFIDGTVVAVVINNMQGSLSATPEQIAWVATSYLVTAAMFMPLMARMCAVPDDPIAEVLVVESAKASRIGHHAVGDQSTGGRGHHRQQQPRCSGLQQSRDSAL